MDDRIDLAKLRKSTEQSGNKELLEKHLRGKDHMNFDEFFKMSKELVEEQIRKNPSLILDSE